MSHLWMRPAEAPAGTYLVVFRCCFSLTEKRKIPFQFSADCRAQLYIDGKRLLEGPERGAVEYWYYQNGELDLEPGNHVFTARVICLEPDIKKRLCAYGQMCIRHGFYIKEDSGLLKDWEYQIESGIEYFVPTLDWGAFPRVKVAATYNAAILAGQGGEWNAVEYFEDDRELHTPDLPLMRYEEIVPVLKSPGVYYFPEYVLVWAQYHFTGHGKVRIRWAETPYLSEQYDEIHLEGVKGNRDGKYFIGNGDEFEVDGELSWTSFWWRAGHYVEFVTEGDVKYEARYFQTGYPYVFPEPKNQLEKMAFETLRACSFETLMDCPYFEQNLYAGDSRIEMLSIYRLTDDHRLAAKCLRMLSCSQKPDGSINAQYPSCSHQIIPCFMPIWLLAVSDYYRIHGEDELIRYLRPRAAKLLDFFAANIQENGLLWFEGWHFTDWYDEFDNGAVPNQPDCILSFFYVMALQQLEEMFPEHGCAKRAEAVCNAIRNVFYDPEKCLYALDAERKHFAEHPQVLALLTMDDTSVIPGLKACNLSQCTIYFSFYYLLACEKYGLTELKEKRLDRWRALMSEGLTTFPENFETPRSDCHAWSSHILNFL